MVKDSEFLTWLADRLVNVYGENPNVDFVHATRRIATALAAPQADPGQEVAQWQMQMANASNWENIEPEDVEFCQVRRGYQVRALYAAPVQVDPEE